MSAVTGTRRRIVRWTLWAATAVTALLVWLRLSEVSAGHWSQVGWSALHQFWLPAVVLVASFSVRGRSTYQVTGSAITGFLTSLGLAMYLGRWITDQMGVVNPYRLALVVPALEEALKLVPFVVVMLLWRRQRRSPGIIDFTLIGLASGAGFAFHEDAMWARDTGGGFASAIGWLLPSVHTQTGVVAGHAVWTGLVGFAIGLAVTRRWRFGGLLVLAAFAVVVFDHGSWNYQPLRDDWRWVVGFGWLAVALVVAVVAIGLWLDVRALRQIPADLRLLPGDVWRFTRTGTVLNPVRRWSEARRLMRAAARAAHGHADQLWTPPAAAHVPTMGETA